MKSFIFVAVLALILGILGFLLTQESGSQDLSPLVLSILGEDITCSVYKRVGSCTDPDGGCVSTCYSPEEQAIIRNIIARQSISTFEVSSVDLTNQSLELPSILPQTGI